ncbi:hypothetical protein [Rickettsia tamurae]
MKKDITALFCFVDDFCKVAEYWISRSFLPINASFVLRCLNYG